MYKKFKIISGGQTGVDQAALNAACKLGIETGGWCPPKRACENGKIPGYFPLIETPEDRSIDAPDIPRSLRTEWNVRDSDATLILQPKINVKVDIGTKWTLKCLKKYKKPYLVCNPEDMAAVDKISKWLNETNVKILNIAGPSEKTIKGITDKCYNLITHVLLVHLVNQE